MRFARWAVRERPRAAMASRGRFASRIAPRPSPIARGTSRMSPSYQLTPCAVCASADSEELVSLDESKAELEELWEYHQKRLRPDTPAIYLVDRVAFSQRAPLRLVRCRECGLVYRNPIERPDRKSTRLNSSHSQISYAVFCLKKKKKNNQPCR